MKLRGKCNQTVEEEECVWLGIELEKVTECALFKCPVEQMESIARLVGLVVNKNDKARGSNRDVDEVRKGCR